MLEAGMERAGLQEHQRRVVRAVVIDPAGTHGSHAASLGMRETTFQTFIKRACAHCGVSTKWGLVMYLLAIGKGAADV